MYRDAGNKMAKKLWMIGKLSFIALMMLVTFCSGVWGALALWYQLPGSTFIRTIGSALWAIGVIALIAIAIHRRSWLPLAAYAVIYAVLLLWWASIAPSNNRIWANDASHLLTGKVDGN